jgi:hypothetical protein
MHIHHMGPVDLRRIASRIGHHNDLILGVVCQRSKRNLQRIEMLLSAADDKHKPAITGAVSS